MEDRIIMSKKDLERKTLLDAHINGVLTLEEISKKLSLSYRQTKRIWTRYKREKERGLIHGNCGRPPSNAYSQEFRDKILDLYEKKYVGFGPTFAAEKMLEDDRISVHPETLRLWLKAEGLWKRKRKHIVYRERRPRREGFGDLLQIDGSIHQWFSEDARYYCLLNIVDDATGTCLALLDRGETTEVLLATFKKWLEKYGIPKAVYVDLKSVYVSPKMLKEKYDDDLLIQEGFSVFEQVCKTLNIQIIRAYSPQAKGRVERKHAVFQDRLVKEFKLYNIKTIAAANEHLEKFVIKINNKFAKPLDDLVDVHRSIKPYGNLNEILCWKYRRQLRNDWTIQFKKQYFQIQKGYDKVIKPNEFITIKKYLNGEMCFWYEDTKLKYSALKRKPIPPSELRNYYKPVKNPITSEQRSVISKRNKGKTPWSKYNSNWLKSA